ncbi:P-loop containing nucleoside triphosphate hydrolase protein [Cunninghamella echinulata]|nr:P-loop containing nucleoside triphosphate hydrolase protein [Cunninghamella echinulata]
MVTPPLHQQLELYVNDTKVWFLDENDNWVSATCISKQIDDKEYTFESLYKDLEKTNGSTLPPLRNPAKLESTDDLTNLSYLNEPSVLNTIKKRYENRVIYTYSGIVLIATNPFDRVSLYEPEIIQKYSGSRRGDLDPHLFAIAEDAYRCMIRDQQNQTIIVSGESGAGKTVSAKYIMRYFATADDKETTGRVAKTDQEMTEVEEQILATNPIMEAFGNAKTTRNDNSSRFGKYIEIHFDKKCNITGAKIKTYLLERSRLIYQPETERNYHIFYQLCNGLSEKEREKLKLKSWTDYHYLNQSGTGEIPGVDDAEEFDLTQKSLSKVGITTDIQNQLFQLLAALLHMGNIDITGRGDAMISEEDESLNLATKFLGIKTSEFRKWIVRRQITTRSEKIVTNLNPAQAQVVRDSVAKYIYANLFDWIVNVVNETLASSSAEKCATFIGVLDIYGFEHFKKNSFEQFCINYANEKLQQQFNQHVFKLEQEEYVREQIDWKFIEFSDNQKCIEMIESKLGILSLLDEESRLPSGNDQGFCTKLYQAFSTPSYQDYFKKPRFSNSSFTVVHYAHDVEYESEGFLDKNKDAVPDELLALLQGSEFKFLVDMVQNTNVEAESSNNNAKRLSVVKKPTLGSIFKLSLINLMDTIAQTNVHYIRCIKPNEAKAAWKFEPNMVLSQLRACGVLETIRISCSGYPTRWTFSEFTERYYALVSAEHWFPRKDVDERKLCSIILDSHIKEADRYQIGLTKIFFRAGQLAYLEKLRNDRWAEVAILIQKNVRRFLARKHYKRIQELIIKVQQVARKKHAQAKLQELRQIKAAIVIQSHWKRYKARKEFLERRHFIIQVQTLVRSLIAKKHFAMLRQHNAATVIQSAVRGWIVRKQVKAKIQFIVRLQTCIRRKQARKQLGVIKAEVRSVSHYKEVSYKLDNRVLELTESLTKQKEEKIQLKARATELEKQIMDHFKRNEDLLQRANKLSSTMGDYNDEDGVKNALTPTREDLEKFCLESFNKIKQQDKQIEQLKEDLAKRRESMTNVNEASQKAIKSLTDTPPSVSELKATIAGLKKQLSYSWNHQPQRSSLRSSTINKQNSLKSPLSSKTNETGKGIENLDMDIQVSQELITLLLDEQILHKEIFESLIRLPIKIPNQSTTIITDDHVTNGNSKDEVQENESDDGGQQLDKADIFLPAQIINTCIMTMWKLGKLRDSEQFALQAIHVIRKYCQEQSDNKTLATYLFWLTNSHQLLSLIFNAEAMSSPIHQHAVDQVSNKIKYELQLLENDLFDLAIKEIHTKLNKIAIPAVIESQSLPGYLATDAGRMFSSQAAYTMDDLIHYIQQVISLLGFYQLEESTNEQFVNEAMKYIGVNCFNDLVSRRNYNSWKRAMQIQYNLSRLEEWCKENDRMNAMLELEYLAQATKVLQLKKSTLDDIEIICNVCWMLSPTQIQKLLQNYHIAEYEEPINHDIIRSVPSKSTNSDNKQLLLENDTLDNTVFELSELRDVSQSKLASSDVKVSSF